VTQRTGDTRERIKQVALELFTEHGYEQTSLREIAERLDVTKAALYYHFKSKEEIVRAVIEDRAKQMDELIDWAKAQPPGDETRLEFIRRYSADLDASDHHALMRFMEQNQLALKSMAIGETVRQRMFDLIDILAGPDASPAGRLRTAFSVFVLHTGWFILRDPSITDEQRREASVEVAVELATGRGRSVAGGCQTVLPTRPATR
jgi:AcrR family transcriptional regulator